MKSKIFPWDPSSLETLKIRYEKKTGLQSISLPLMLTSQSISSRDVMRSASTLPLSLSFTFYIFSLTVSPEYFTSWTKTGDFGMGGFSVPQTLSTKLSYIVTIFICFSKKYLDLFLYPAKIYQTDKFYILPLEICVGSAPIYVPAGRFVEIHSK